jgi:iron complex outermembrane receptor protein
VKQIFFSIIFVAASVAATAQHSLRGRVLDNSVGQSLSGAIISLPDLKTGTITDSNGYYSITKLPKGSCLVEVRMIGYNAITKRVIVENETEANFVLGESVLERDEVVVTGTSLATEQRKAVIPIMSIRMRELQQNVSSNIVDAIATQPGISQVTTGPAISKPVIRGLSHNRIITMNDGIRQEGQQWGDEHGIEIDDENVSRVEVLKGPASLAYGSDALAGVVNIISDDPLPLNTIRGNVVANYQSNSGLYALHGKIQGNIDGYSWKLYLTEKAAHDYKNRYDGYVHNSRFNNRNYGATIGLNRKWGYSHLIFTSFSQELGLVEGERDSATGDFLKLVNDNGVENMEVVSAGEGRSYNVLTPSQNITHNRLSWNNSIYLSNGSRFNIVLGLQQNERREFDDVTAPATPGLHLNLHTYNYDLSYFFAEWNDWHVSAGVNGMLQRNTNHGSEFLIPDHDLSDIGAYTIARKEWGKLSVLAGLRFNSRNISVESLYLDSLGERSSGIEPGGTVLFAGFKNQYSNLAGSLGASYSVTDRAAIKANIATGFRAPNIAELSANGVHEGAIRYEYGNTLLKPENSIQTDIGYSWNSEHVEVSTAVFYNYVRNFIFIRKLLDAGGNDSIPVVNNDEGFPAFVYTQNNAALYGGEFYIDLHPHPLDWLHIDNSFSYVRGIIFNGTDSTGNLPYIPAARWTPELRAQKRTLGKMLANSYLRIGANVVFTQNNIFNAYGTETRTAGYTFLDAGLGTDIVNRKKKILFSVNVAVKNITNVAYQDHLSRLKYAAENSVTGRSGVYNTGRNFSIRINVPFSIR